MSTIDTDQPKSTLEEDRFQRYEFAKRIAGIIKGGNLVKSLVIGIYGKWGEGKTSVMNFIKQELTEDIVVVNFNPWLFSSEDQLMKSFFSSLAFELDQSLETNKEKAGKLLSEYGQAIGTVTKLVGLSLDGLKEVGDKLQEVSIEKLKTRVDDMIKATGKKIVVCVDDIDRLDVKEIQHIFKLIKLVGDFPGTTYVLAFDDEMVASALAPQYGSKQSDNGYTFLEKIIQLPLKIPKATQPALKKYVLDMLSGIISGLNIEVTQDEVNKFRSTFDDYYVPHIDNPRLASRFTNAAYFALPLLFGEVNTTDLILLEGLKILFPTAYDFTRHNSSLFLTDTSLNSNGRSKKIDRDQIIKDVNLFLQTLPESKSNAVKEIWKQLFPQYRFTVGNMGYRDDKWRDWYKQKRICSGAYFERYFTYTVREGDISDVMFQGFLSDLENLSVDQCQEKISLFFAKNSMSDIIFKLRLWEDGLNEKQSITLATLLARKGDELPIERGEFASFTTNAEGAKTVAHLLLNLPIEQRGDELIELLKQTGNIEFAMEIFYWLIYKKQRSGQELIHQADEDRAKLFLIDRFKTENKNQDFFDILPDTEAWRLLSWWRDSNSIELQTTVENAVDGLAENVVKLIKVFTPTITSFGGKESNTFKSGFDEKNYASMIETLDVDFAYKILQTTGYAREEYNLSSIPDRDSLTDSQLANIFMQFFEKDLSDDGQISNVPTANLKPIGTDSPDDQEMISTGGTDS